MYTQWVDLFLNWLMVAYNKLVEMTIAAALDEDFLSWVQMLQEILTLPRLYEVIKQATPEAWEQARLDYMTLCQFLQNTPHYAPT